MADRTDQQTRRYRVEINIPRVAYPQETTWRTLTIQDSYADVGDVADYLVESMVLEGIPLAMARQWVAKRLRVKQVTTTVVNGEPETMPLVY